MAGTLKGSLVRNTVNLYLNNIGDARGSPDPG